MKKVISILISVVMIFGVFAVTASAEDIPAGIYNIGTKANMAITAVAAGETVEATSVDVNLDGKEDTLYAGADGLEVTYTGATDGAYYGIILVEDRGLPTVDSEIYYIDQVTAEGDSFDFEVYPKLPAENTALTLYVSSSVADAALESVPLSYRLAGPAVKEEASYVIGDIDANGAWNSIDALMALQIGANLMPEATAEQEAAADVNGDNLINSTDALTILQYGAGLIKNWN